VARRHSAPCLHSSPYPSLLHLHLRPSLEAKMMNYHPLAQAINADQQNLREGHEILTDSLDRSVLNTLTPRLHDSLSSSPLRKPTPIVTGDPLRGG